MLELPRRCRALQRLTRTRTVKTQCGKNKVYGRRIGFIAGGGRKSVDLMRLEGAAQTQPTSRHRANPYTPGRTRKPIHVGIPTKPGHPQTYAPARSAPHQRFKAGSAPTGWFELKQSSTLHAIACPAPRDQHALEAGQSSSSSRCKTEHRCTVSTPSAEVAKLLLKTKLIALNNAHHA